ncbi:MAG TPA: hypothetical protein VKA55_02190, partial [Gammaproteobacteria bacterium]|nr:hypothetical protein [Gammaproteobacteria bacterium]
PLGLGADRPRHRLHPGQAHGHGRPALNSLAELLIAFTDLLEAEARALRRGTVKTASGVALAGLAALSAAVGLGFLLWALFAAMAATVGMAGAAGITGTAGLIVAGVLAWIAGRISR